MGALESRLRPAQERADVGLTAESQIMTTTPDPFEPGQRAARKHIPAAANPYRDGSDEHALWAAGHEKSAGEMEADQSEGN